jgi:hypothetical protein
MVEDLAFHVADLVENALRAGAKLVLWSSLGRVRFFGFGLRTMGRGWRRRRFAAQVIRSSLPNLAGGLGWG